MFLAVRIGSVAADGEILYHTGFDSEEALAAWGRMPGWKFAAGGGRNGTGAAVLSRNAFSGPNVKMPVDNLRPGVLYRLTVWVRPELLESQDHNQNYGAFCVEYERGGKWFSGNYPLVSHRENGWKKCSLDFVLKAGADRANLVLYLRKGFRGRVFFDDLLLEEAGDPRAAILVTSPSQLTFYGDGGVLELTGTASAKGALKMLLQVEQGGHSRELSCGESEPRRFRFVLKNLLPGRLNLKMRLSDAAGNRSHASAEQTLFVRQGKESGTGFDEANRMLVRGIPFMPVGIFGGFQSVEDLRTVRRAGFNTILQYDCFSMKFGGNGKSSMDTIRKSLDAIERSGLKLIFSLKDQLPGKRAVRRRLDEADSPEKVVRLAVESLRDHPALLAWYLSDEDSRAELRQLIRLRECVSEIDPAHPTVTLTFRHEDLPVYGRSGDVLAIDDYPIRRRKGNDLSSLFRLAEAAALGGQPVWIVPQVFNWGIYKAKDREDFQQSFTFPSEAEMRAMVLAGVVYGAKGFIFYSYMDVFRRIQKYAPGSEKAEWPKVVRTVALLKQLEPYIMSRRKIEFLPVEQTGKGVVKAAVLTADDGRRAVIVIAADENASGKVGLPDGISGSRTFRFAPGAIDAVVLFEKE